MEYLWKSNVSVLINEVCFRSQIQNQELDLYLSMLIC